MSKRLEFVARLALACSLTGSLAGCGSGGDSSSAPTPTALPAVPTVPATFTRVPVPSSVTPTGVATPTLPTAVSTTPTAHVATPTPMTATPTGVVSSTTTVSSTATPTPTSTPTYSGTACPFNFSAPTGSQGCAFVGGWNTACGNSSLVATFIVDSGALTIEFVQPKFYLGATDIQSATEATITSWWTQPDRSDEQPLSGTILLSDDGAQLNVTPSVAPLSISGCLFVGYIGDFRQVLPLSSFN